MVLTIRILENLQYLLMCWCSMAKCSHFSSLSTHVCFLLYQDDSRISVQLITEECVHKLDTKHQTNALLNLVWRDSASEEVFTMMASICHTLMVQHRLMVPKVRYRYTNLRLSKSLKGFTKHYCFIMKMTRKLYKCILIKNSRDCRYPSLFSIKYIWYFEYINCTVHFTVKQVFLNQNKT